MLTKKVGWRRDSNTQHTLANLKGLKELVAKYFPRSSVSYQVIMAEPDEIPMEEYVTKAGTWYRMIEAELRQRP